MKSSSPKELAAFIALISVTLFGGTIIVLNQLHLQILWQPVAIAALVFFLINYFIIYTTLTRFIFEKIQPIYKTIHEYTLSQKQFKKQLDKDIISHVNKEVEDWADKKPKRSKSSNNLKNTGRIFWGM